MKLTTKLAVSALAVSVMAISAPTFAKNSPDSQTKSSEPMKANSTTELSSKMTGKHVDELPEVTSSTKAVQSGDVVVCKKIKKTGSRLGARKVCAPKKEWDQMKATAGQNTKNSQLTRYSGS